MPYRHTPYHSLKEINIQFPQIFIWVVINLLQSPCNKLALIAHFECCNHSLIQRLNNWSHIWWKEQDSDMEEYMLCLTPTTWSTRCPSTTTILTRSMLLPGSNVQNMEKPLLLRHKKIQDSRNQGTRDSSGKAGEDADVIHRICCSSGLFSSISLVIITLTLQILKKNSDIIKGDKDNNEGVLHYGNRFQTCRWQYQGVLLTRVALSRLGCTPGYTLKLMLSVTLQADYIKWSYHVRHCRVDVTIVDRVHWFLLRIGSHEMEDNKEGVDNRREHLSHAAATHF